LVHIVIPNDHCTHADTQSAIFNNQLTLAQEQNNKL
jgi:hypothetical protein